jgi:hypothetical protein
MLEADGATALVAVILSRPRSGRRPGSRRSSDSTGCSAALMRKPPSGKTMSTLSITPPPAAAVSATPH